MRAIPTKEHHPVGEYMPVGQLAGDCSCGRGAWPCPDTPQTVLEDAQWEQAEKIRWRFGIDNGEYVAGWAVWRRLERRAIRFTSGVEAGEVYIWRSTGWQRVITVRGRFREGGNRHD